MNQAMRDLLDSTLDGWYSYLASWEAPGDTGRAGCELCADSPFSRLDGLGEWPHDIVHVLVRDLSAAVRLVRLSLEELDEVSTGASVALADLTPREFAARRAILARHAESLVLSALQSRREAMLDVLEHCIEPALEAYLRAEVERGLLEIFATDERDRPVY